MAYIVLGSLAVWRICSLLIYEDGPFTVFAWLRNAVGVKQDEYSRNYGETFLSKLLCCVWCMSMWVALPLSVLIVSPTISNRALSIILMWLTLSAGAIIVDTFVGRLEK